MKVLSLFERKVMEFREFGDKDRPVVMLLHGGGLNWWNYREQAELLAPRFHVIMPILDGHAGSFPEAVRSCSAQVHVFAGSRENGEILKSVKVLQKGIPGCSVQIQPGLFHGEFSLNHAKEYADAVMSVIEGGKWD